MSLPRLLAVLSTTALLTGCASAIPITPAASALPTTAAPAGPHYQHMHDPASSPAGDPAYANPRNEVWLDFTADATGVGSATAVQDWSFEEMSPPRSLILHAEVTRTGKGVAGMAGPRAAC